MARAAWWSGSGESGRAEGTPWPACSMADRISPRWLAAASCACRLRLPLLLDSQLCGSCMLDAGLKQWQPIIGTTSHRHCLLPCPAPSPPRSESQNLPVVRFASGKVLTIGRERWTVASGGWAGRLGGWCAGQYITQVQNWWQLAPDATVHALLPSQLAAAHLAGFFCNAPMHARPCRRAAGGAAGAAAAGPGLGHHRAQVAGGNGGGLLGTGLQLHSAQCAASLGASPCGSLDEAVRAAVGLLPLHVPGKPTALPVQPVLAPHQHCAVRTIRRA